MSRHPVEAKYGLSAVELLEALDRRFRARVTLEGAVAEVQMERKIRELVGGSIDRFTTHDLDGHPDFSLWLPSIPSPILAECKNVRNSSEAYRENGQIVAYKVELQKTRAAKGDPTSRLYGVNQFQMLGVCLGKKTGNWSDFAFVLTRDLSRHRTLDHKLAVMHRVPLPGSPDPSPWSFSLEVLLERMTKGET